jgi:ribosome biogenesis GTPase
VLPSSIVDLRALGWDALFERHFEEHRQRGLTAARVTLEHQHIYTVHTTIGESLATVAGGLRHRAEGRHEFPAVGDWVAITPITPGRRGVIQTILPRRSKFSRKVAGRETTEQVVAANIDTVFLMMGLDGDYNLRRIERYLITARDGGASPVVVLNKADVCDDVPARMKEVQSVAQAAPVHAVSTKQDGVLDVLDPYLAPGRTIALLGSSGVGKSTLVNRLVGHQMQKTRAVRISDHKGRHTTTQRQLIIVAGGALLIDTPGLRELQLWDGAGGMDATFDDVEVLGAGCRFRDCQHDAEPGCAVKAAAEAGQLDGSRLDSYRELHKERAFLASQQDVRAAQERKRASRTISKAIREIKSRE